MAFHRRIDVGEGADGTGDGAGGDLDPRAAQPLAGAFEGRIMSGELQAEGRGLGMDAVAASDADRVLVLEGPALERRQQSIEVIQQNVGSLLQLHRQAGVEHVGGGHALMHEARRRPDMFGDIGQEGDDVVLGLALDFVDARRPRNCRASRSPRRPSWG